MTSSAWKIPESKETSDSKKCALCNKAHNIDVCYEFVSKPISERKAFASTKGLCFGCLEYGHLSKDCPKGSTCNVCKRSHPTSLHGDFKRREGEQGDTSTAKDPNRPLKSTIMDEDQKKDLEKLLKDFAQTLKGDIEKDSETHKTQLASLQSKFDKKKSPFHNLKPDTFDGNPVADALEWLSNFQRIAKLNNWTADLQLNAFPLYLQGIAHAWFLSLPPEVANDLKALFDAFQERFGSGPQEWILSQQLSARKHNKGEAIDDYIADITRLCKRLKLSDNETMRYFIEGLQGDLQAYVSLSRPKNFRDAESLARMKDIVNKRQGFSDTQSVLEQMQTMFSKLVDKSAANNKVIAAAAPGSDPEAHDRKYDELTRQIKQLQKQQQQQEQQFHATYAMAAYDQPPGTWYPFPPTNWQGDTNQQLAQLQNQVTRLKHEFRRYHNPRHSEFRSYGRHYRNSESNYHGREQFPSAYQPRTCLLALEAPPRFRNQSNQLNA
ncbi:hypothetical protein ACROYT_G017880 [Oculina patagonica]